MVSGEELSALTHHIKKCRAPLQSVLVLYSHLAPFPVHFIGIFHVVSICNTVTLPSVSVFDLDGHADNAAAPLALKSLITRFFSSSDVLCVRSYLILVLDGMVIKQDVLPRYYTDYQCIFWKDKLTALMPYELSCVCVNYHFLI